MFASKELTLLRSDSAPARQDSSSSSSSYINYKGKESLRVNRKDDVYVGDCPN